MTQAWLKANREKYRQSCHRYYIKNRERMLGQTRKWAAEHPDRLKKLQDDWRKRNRKKLAAKRSTASAKNYMRTWRKNNRDKTRAYNAKQRESDEGRFKRALKRSQETSRIYGYVACTATIEEIKAAFTGCCNNPGCRLQESSHRRRLSLDHDHKTGKFRGWLCANCNSAAGFLNECSFRAEGLWKYLCDNTNKRR